MATTMITLRRAFTLVVLLLVIAAAAHAQPPDVKAAAEPALRQLDAFRRNDYDAAYTFASAEIHRLFDRQAFERMVRELGAYRINGVVARPDPGEEA